MQSLGLNKCNNENIKYYDKISKNESINIDYLDINKISSTVLNSEVISTEFIESSNELRVIVSIDLKIIYSKNGQNSLYAYEDKILSISYISIPKSIDGISSKIAFIQKKFKTQVFIENIGSKKLNNKILLINFYMIVNIQVSPSFCLAYCIDNNLFENIFISFSDGKNLTQVTSTNKFKYSNIFWDSKNSNILFTTYENNNSYINILNSNTKDVSKVNSKYVPGILSNYCLLNNNILISTKENSNDVLYTYNPKKDELNQIQTNPHTSKIIKLYFSKSLNTLFCISNINGIDALCSMDKQNNLSTLFDFYDVCDYVVNDKLNKVFINLLKDNKNLYYILNLDSKMLNPINFDFDFNNIIKVKYVSDDMCNELLVLLYSYENKHYLCMYDLINLSSKILYINNFVRDFDVNESSLEVFIVTNNDNFSQIIKLDYDKEEEIMKTSSIIKEICLK